MARTKSVSMESVCEGFNLLELEDKIKAMKFMTGKLEDELKLHENTIIIAQNSIEKLREVVPVKE